MRILVYGAGVQGCELAHRLLQNKKNVVTMLARGEWKERIDQKGLTIVDFGAVVRAAAGVGIVQQVGGLLVIGRVDHAGHAHAGGDIADGVLVQYCLPVVGRALGRYRQLRQVFRVNRFTAVGVQRGGCCQGFRFRRGSSGGFRGRCGAPSQHPGAKQHCRQTGGTAGNGRHR